MSAPFALTAINPIPARPSTLTQHQPSPPGVSARASEDIALRTSPLARRLAAARTVVAPDDPSACPRAGGPVGAEELLRAATGVTRWELDPTGAAVAAAGIVDHRGASCSVQCVEEQVIAGGGAAGPPITLRFTYRLGDSDEPEGGAITMACTLPDGTRCARCSLELASATK